MQKFSSAKKFFLAAELACVFFAIVLPPIFAPFSAQDVSVFRFRWSAVFLYAALAAFFLLNRKFFFEPLKAKVSAFPLALVGVFAFCLISLASRLFSLGAEKISFDLPKIQSFGDFFKFAAMLVLGASVEEFLFRDFLLEIPKILFDGAAQAPFFAIFSCVFFALAHRYLGVCAVWNALFAGAVLLAVRAKFQTLLLPCAIHAACNALSFFLISTGRVFS